MAVKVFRSPDGKLHHVLESKDPNFLVEKVKQDYFVKIPQKWWRGELKSLRPIERCLLVSLRILGQRSASTNHLAKELGITWRTTKKGIESLRKKGFLPYAKKQK